MVSTRRAEKARQSTEEGSLPVASGDEYEERTPEPTKTRGTKRVRATKTTAKSKQQPQEKRRKKAKLSMLPEMPVDILYDIFSLVHPKDLMHISWTAKTLNQFLTGKSSRHVWQASFKTLQEVEQLPPCPSEMTEMAYANLLYGQCCMNCGNARPQISAWCALVRLCGYCVQEIAMDLYSARPSDLPSKTVGNMREVLPTFYVTYANGGREVEKVLRLDSKRFSEELAAARDSSAEVIQKYTLLVNERKEFSDALLRIVRATEMAAEKAKEDARADVQKQRIDRIWEKLSEEGWRDEIATRKSMYEPGLKEIKGVIMHRPLGEKGWAELRDRLNEFMRSESKKVHARLDWQRCDSRIVEVQKIVDTFRSSLPHPHDFSPSAADICWIPEVQKAIIDGTDKEFQVCKVDLRSRIPELSATWLEERRSVFLQLLPQDSPSLEHLSLATTLFSCTECRKFSMRIEKALSHCCRYQHDSTFKTKFSSTASANRFLDRAGIPWNSRPITKYQYSTDLSALVREVVLECGEDPDTITVQEMNRKHYRFVRFGKYSGMGVLNWLQAFEHKRDRKDESRRRLRSDELPEYVPDPETRKGDWGCVHCWRTGEPRWSSKMFNVIKDHLADSHQITNPAEEDYYHAEPNFTLPLKYKPGNSV